MKIFQKFFSRQITFSFCYALQQSLPTRHKWRGARHKWRGTRHKWRVVKKPSTVIPSQTLQKRSKSYKKIQKKGTCVCAPPKFIFKIFKKVLQKIFFYFFSKTFFQPDENLENYLLSAGVKGRYRPFGT